MKTLTQIFEAKETDYNLQDYIQFNEVPIEIENKKGSIRKGKDKNGKFWAITMNADYGRIPLTKDNTGEFFDVYIGPNKNSNKIFVIQQLVPETGKKDELKWMICFDSKEEAIKLYKSQYTRSGFYGGIKEFTIEQFKSIVFKNIMKNISNY